MRYLVFFSYFYTNNVFVYMLLVRSNHIKMESPYLYMAVEPTTHNPPANRNHLQTKPCPRASPS